jgi:glutathione synthase/RimK-type ligase-like ATP-grasp enzyme
VLKAPGDLSANTPIECLLEGSDIAVELLYVGPGFPLPDVPPEHDLLFVAVAESNENRPVLEYLHHRLAGWPRPCLNPPAEILKLERSRACDLLSPVAGIVMPRTIQVDRETLRQIAHGELPIHASLAAGEFPILVRPIDSHAGRGLIKAESPRDLLSYLDERSDSSFFLSRFIDYRSADGLFRKYRIVIMHGQSFLCHMGISDHWMVHYPYQEMIPDAARRAEEEQAMTSFDETFALRHQAALTSLCQKIQLDYIGLDCAESSEGELVIFEVASAMLVHAMDNPEIFPYKAAQMKKTFDAFRRTLHRSHQAARSRK